MTTFVIVHGAWGGGWEWSPVADILRSYGHRAFTPTLTGMGERAHLSRGEAVGLGTHIDDIVAVLESSRPIMIVSQSSPLARRYCRARRASSAKPHCAVPCYACRSSVSCWALTWA
jgi:hypothetical protein